MTTIITESETYTIPLNALVEDPDNIRTQFDQAKLVELADSIAGVGLLQPLTVRHADSESDQFVIVAGARRYRAMQLLVKKGLLAPDAPVSATMRAAQNGQSDADATAAMLVENLQREDVLPMDEARGYLRLTRDHGFKIKDLAKKVGRSTTHITQRISLLTLPEDLQACVGITVSIDTAADIARVQDDKKRKSLAKQAVKGTLGSWTVETALREERKAADAAKLDEWAAKNMVTIFESRIAPGCPAADDQGNWVRTDEFDLDGLLKGKYAAKKGDVLTKAWNGGIAVWHKLTKAELAARDKARAEEDARRAAAGQAPAEREVTPLDEWEDRYDAHERAVEEYEERIRSIVPKVILDLPAKTVGKIILEQRVASVMNFRTALRYFPTDSITELFGIEVVDTTPAGALLDWIGTSTDRALRVDAARFYFQAPTYSDTLAQAIAVETSVLGLVDPGEFTEPEPWQDDDGVWHTEPYSGDESGLANVEDYDDDPADDTTEEDPA